MRHVKVITRTGEGSYRYAAVDCQTGDVLLQLSEAAALLALCQRLEWEVEQAAASSRQPKGKHRGTQCGKPKRRVGGSSKYTIARRRRFARLGL
jgi:hypothetical protein